MMTWKLESVPLLDIPFFVTGSKCQEDLTNYPMWVSLSVTRVDVSKHRMALAKLVFGDDQPRVNLFQDVPMEARLCRKCGRHPETLNMFRFSVKRIFSLAHCTDTSSVPDSQLTFPPTLRMSDSSPTPRGP
jgi:hypothetical protein